eukprot:969327_1
MSGSAVAEDTAAAEEDKDLSDPDARSQHGPKRRRLSEPVNRCDACSLDFESNADRVRHLEGRRHNRGILAQVIRSSAGRLTRRCEICQMNFTYQEELLVHVQGARHQRAILMSNSNIQSSRATEPSPATGTADLPQVASDEVVPIRGVARTMASMMTASNAIPTFSICDEVRMDRLEEARQEMKVWMAEEGVRLTLMTFFIKAASLALLQYP